MKNVKKLLVLAMCVAVLGSMTGCGNKDDAVDGADNGTTNTTTDERKDKNPTDGMKDATDGTINKNNNRTDNAANADRTENNRTENGTNVNRTDDNGDGIIDNAVHDVTDGIDDITDDLTGNDHRDDNAADQDNTRRDEAGTNHNGDNR